MTKLDTSLVEQQIDNLMITSFPGRHKCGLTMKYCVLDMRISFVIELEIKLLQ